MTIKNLNHSIEYNLYGFENEEPDFRSKKVNMSQVIVWASFINQKISNSRSG